MVRRKEFLAAIVFVILIGFGILGNNAMAGWITGKVADALKKGCGYQRGIVVDDDGHPHIAFGGSYLYYIYHDGNNWCPDSAESISFSSFEVNYVSIARDSENNMHISYFDAVNQDLWYASNTSGSWQIEPVDEFGDKGRFTSIAVDSENNMHISYFDAVNQDLWYASNTSGSWQTELIDKNGNTGLYTSIAIDSTNKVHISYYDDSNQNLMYITGSSNSWQPETVDSNGNVGEYTSLALDSNNKVHISYYDANNNDLRYATNASGSWQTEIVDGSGSVGEYTSLALDSLNNVHISYYDAGNHDLKYAVGTSGLWQIETVDSGEDVGKYTSIAVCSFNKVHISYYDADNQALKYAAKSISIDNRPPILSQIGSQTINEGFLLEFTISATDPDVGDVLTYSIDPEPPTGAEFDPNTQIFSWTPGYGDAGNYKVTFTVIDNVEPFETDSETVNITVGNVNRRPEFLTIGTQTVNEGVVIEFTINEGELLEFTITATDLDADDVLTYSLDSTLPNGDYLDSHGIFSWEPGYDYVSNEDSREIELHFSVDDGEDNDSQVVSITINNVNRPPEFDEIEKQEEGNEGELLKFTIEATDPDDDNLTYSLDLDSTLPVGADFDPYTGIFSWTPGYDYVSNKNSKEEKLAFWVNDGQDGQYDDLMPVTITIYDVNQPPVFVQIQAQTVKQGELLEFTITATDADEDNLTYSVDSPLPNGASFDPYTRTFSWAPEYGDVGSYEVTFTVTDDGDTTLSDFEIVPITVTLLSNYKPYPPTLSYPDSNQCDVSLTPELQTDDFFDPDADGTHAQTQWRIFKEDDDLLPVLDITSVSYLTNVVIGESVLDGGTSYYWQVRFYDNHSTASDWSNRYSFTTCSDNDNDSNGVPDDQEVTFEIDDMDNYGGSDREQNDIKCVNTEVGNGQIGVSIKDSPDVISIESIKSIDPTAISGNNKPENMPLGLISFKVKVNTIGDSVQVTIYLSPPATDGAKWYKYDPINGWRVYPYADFSDDGTSVTLQLKDGDMEYGDVDGTENGIIVDPSGFSISSITDIQDNQEEGINSSQGGGCFIATTAYRVSKIIVSKFLPEK